MRPSLIPLTLSVVLAACTADVRPDSLAGKIDETRTAEARKLLAACADAHGGAETFATARDASLTVTVEFVTLTGKLLVQEWPDAKTQVRLDALLGTDDARLTFLDGEWKDHSHGVQNWVTYAFEPSGAFTVSPADDPVAMQRFWPPTLGFLLFMPFRVQSADIVQYVGDKTIDGRTYAEVFLTWGGMEPRDTVDQYLLYIDRETHVLRYATFTVRDSGSFIVATIDMSKHERVDGLLIPHFLYSASEPGDRDVFSHTITVNDAKLAVGRELRHYRPAPKLRSRK